MNLRRTLLAAAMLVGIGMTAGRADAQCGGFGGYGGWGGYWGVGQMYQVLADNVPYYAAFPPVYYSAPVPRTYGYSPFAYPPGVMTPDVECAPLAIENPYFQGSATVEAKSEANAAAPAPVDRTTQVAQPAGPLMVVNPYVVDGAAVAQQ
jgi:hypothetical protein